MSFYQRIMYFVAARLRTILRNFSLLTELPLTIVRPNYVFLPTLSLSSSTSSIPPKYVIQVMSGLPIFCTVEAEQQDITQQRSNVE